MLSTQLVSACAMDVANSQLAQDQELIQNADDAQATEVAFVWDWRQFGTQSLISPEMARWQGPCLWAYNDASFTAQDFENITQLGAMQKSSSGGGTSQIGRFGLGFNSVYRLCGLGGILVMWNIGCPFNIPTMQIYSLHEHSDPRHRPNKIQKCNRPNMLCDSTRLLSEHCLALFRPFSKRFGPFWRICSIASK